ncbi:PAP/fibrillin family protein [Myxococcota bacterium]|nr:PAP/fibrillin family protein [Myxococcota bacterium]
MLRARPTTPARPTELREPALLDPSASTGAARADETDRATQAGGAPRAARTPAGRADSIDRASIAKARASSSVTKALPPEVRAAKMKVLELASANTLSDDVKAVRAELEPHVRVLADWFAKNRPADEVEQTKGTWKSLFYDSPDLERGPLPLDKANIYQVVEKDYYWNISNTKVEVLGLRLGTLQGFLKGNYSIDNPASPENRGQQRVNVIDLEFAETRVRPGALPRDVNLRELAAQVNDRELFTLPSPGPRGIRGNLWNLYVDADLRISAGINTTDAPQDLQLYVLKRATTPSR